MWHESYRIDVGGASYLLLHANLLQEGVHLGTNLGDSIADCLMLVPVLIVLFAVPTYPCEPPRTAQ